jgi:hypothetical protein
MPIQKRRPAFGAKRMTDVYYTTVNSITAVLRGHSTLAVICDHLNSQKIPTPSGLTWNRDRLSSYLKTYESKTN